MRRRTFLTTGWLNILFQMVFLVVLYAVGRHSPGIGDGAWRTIVLLLLVGVPSALWTGFFYLRDYNAPEPSRYVIAAFLSGMAAASAFALPIERDIFETDVWIYESIISLMLGATLVRGTLVSVLMYLVMRYGFYPSREFDEPIDGMVYGAFAGCGFAAITSLTYLIDHPHFTLFAIGYIASTNILIYASVAALVGYLVGRTKFFPGHTQGSHILAIAVGLILTGLYHTANEIVLLSGWQDAFWRSFGLTLALSAGVLALSAWLLRGLAGASVHDTIGLATPQEFTVWGCAVALLLAGGVVAYMAMRDVTFRSESHRMTFQYPAARLKPAILLSETSGLSPLIPAIFSGNGRLQRPFSFSVGARKESVQLSAIDPLAYLGTSAPLSLAIANANVAGKAALRVRYAHLTESTAEADTLPSLVWTSTDIVPRPDHTYVFTFEATPETFRQQAWLYERILASVTWTPE